jgi:hypothetical protein
MRENPYASPAHATEAKSRRNRYAMAATVFSCLAAGLLVATILSGVLESPERIATRKWRPEKPEVVWGYATAGLGCVAILAAVGCGGLALMNEQQQSQNERMEEARARLQALGGSEPR